MSDVSEVLESVQKEVKTFGDNIKGLKDTMEKDLASVRKLAEEAGAKAGDATQLKADISALTTGVAAKHDAIEKQVKKILDDAIASTSRFDDFEKKLNRARISGGGDPATETEMKGIRDFHKTALARRGQLAIGADLSDEKIDIDGIKSYSKEFATYLRRDTQGSDHKAMSVGSDPDGGYWVTPAVSARLLSIVYESSPMREIAEIETISSDAIEYPIDDGEGDAGWVGETQTRAETNTPQIGVQRIPVHELYAKPKATQKLLEDSSVDIEAWLGRKTGEKFGRVEATAFVTGNGINKPRGFTTYLTGTTRGFIEQIVSGAATAVTADGLINLIIALKEPYVANAQFLMRRATVGNVMLLKDGNGQYIWRPGLEAGKPSILLGHPVRQAADMAAVGANALAIAFGDFKRGYTIVDRLGITTLRDPYSEKPFVQFYSRKRVGGDVTNFEAIKIQKISA